ncbi:MAG: hypothetical protein C0514_01280 [Candidatus Puniceispirillum sp.]|nr:hypothetical protein [Candidatus Puniceispirillum sp.]
MTQTFKKSTRYALGLLFLGSPDMASATHRIDDPTAYEGAARFAKTLPYATGIVLGSDASMASAIFLNETTAPSCAHVFAGRSSTQNTIIAADEIELLYTSSGAYDCAATLTHAIRSGRSHQIS